MEHQDHTIINIGHGRNKNPPKKLPIQKNPEIAHAHKIENQEDNFKLDKIPKKICTQIISLRNSQKLTQKDMATRINVQKNIYIELENGKAKYDPQTKQIIQKIQKTFGTKFEK